MVVAVLVGGILVAGCSTDSRRQAGADESNVTEHVGELRIGIVEPMSADPATVNPTHAIDLLAADLLYDGLTSYDTVSGQAVPELAESWDTADGITWTFHLAERTFSDGSPVTAAAVVASLERLRAMTSTSLAAGRLDVVAAMSAPTATDVQIVLDVADYELPALLADPAFGVVADSSIAPTIASQTPVSGSFRVQSGGPDGATLVTVDDAVVDIDGVEFVRFDDAAAAQAALAAGSIDIAPLGRDDVAPDRTTEHLASGATLVAELGAANGVWKDTANRQAVLHTLDRDAIAVAAAGTADRRADSLVPAGVLATGGCSAGCAPSADGPTVLGVLGATSGPVPVDVPIGDDGVTAANALIGQLSAAGLPAELRTSDSAALRTTLAAGQLQLAVFVVVGSAPTPDPYLAATLSSVGSENLSGYASAEFDAGLSTARGTADPAARRAAYEQLEAVALAAAPVIPLVSLGERFAVSDRVLGVDSVAGLLLDGTKVRLGR